MVNLPRSLRGSMSKMVEIAGELGVGSYGYGFIGGYLGLKKVVLSNFGYIASGNGCVW